ncbi:hypothetical protein ABXN37_29285, partial [Piscinibacter sakaiensis]|uniref:hypothetical protein n=2 Tax=Piscinibacter sakaiensis TaxID=1547922 RepID=UPI00372B3628
MATRKTTPTGPLCVVTIGYLQLLLPMAKGLKFVELLQDAPALGYDMERSQPGCYLVGEPPTLELSMVKAEQLRAKPTEAPGGPPRDAEPGVLRYSPPA